MGRKKEEPKIEFSAPKIWLSETNRLTIPLVCFPERLQFSMHNNYGYHPVKEEDKYLAFQGYQGRDEFQKSLLELAALLIGQALQLGPVDQEAMTNVIKTMGPRFGDRA